MAKRERANEETEYYKKLGQKIRNVRIEKGISQKTLAEYLKVSHSAFVTYESGKVNIPLYILNKTADFLNVSIDYLIADFGSREELFARYGMDFESFIEAFETVPSGTLDLFEKYKSPDILKSIIEEIFMDSKNNLNVVGNFFFIFKILELLKKINIQVPLDIESSTEKSQVFIIEHIPDILSATDIFVMVTLKITILEVWIFNKYIQKIKHYRAEDKEKKEIRRVWEYDKNLNFIGIKTIKKGKQTKNSQKDNKNNKSKK